MAPKRDEDYIARGDGYDMYVPPTRSAWPYIVFLGAAAVIIITIFAYVVYVAPPALGAERPNNPYVRKLITKAEYGTVDTLLKRAFERRHPPIPATQSNSLLVKRQSTPATY